MQINMRIIIQKFMKKLTTHVPYYTQIYFPYYSIVTSAYQGSVLVLAPLLFLER